MDAIAREVKARMELISESDALEWLNHDAIQEYIRTINNGEGKLWRHEMRLSGPPNKRAQMKYVHSLGNVVSRSIINRFSMALLKIYSQSSMQNFNYVMDVLVPEAVVKFLMEKADLEYNQADKLSTFQLFDELDDIREHPSPKSPTTLQSSTATSHSPPTFSPETKAPIPQLDTEQAPIPCQSGSLRNFSEEELDFATRSFSQLVGKGSFGCVYKGVMQHIPVAVKVMDPKALQDINHTTFATEVQALTRFRHPNLINLMGICRTKPALIYPFMERLSLFHALHEYKVEVPLSWEERIRVLRLVACALSYLHSSSPPYVHRDIKTHNILLDSSLTPHVADFGFLMTLPLQYGSRCLVTSAGSIALAGTRGYLAPEFVAGKIAPKCDVYSYGIVCLETYTGELAYSTTRDDDNLIDYCEDSLATLHEFSRCADAKVVTPSAKVVEAFHTIICKSTQRNYKKRCLMEEVLHDWN